MAESVGAASLLVAVFLLILGVLWFFLPFAIFGIKDKLDRLIYEQKRTADLLQYIAENQQK